MQAEFDLVQYLEDGVRHFVAGAMRAALHNPKQTAFLLGYAAAARRAAKRRRALHGEGEHIPSFLIASITEECNLHCAGCYHHARAAAPRPPLPREGWAQIFAEAGQIGVAMILLAGGEPLMRPEVLQEAARCADIAFPVFTNGTLLAGGHIRLFDKHRNLIPIISIEGSEAQTDARRGPGVYAHTMRAMDRLRQAGVLFGASLTVTRDNMADIAQDAFVRALEEKGCKAALFIEYVPVEDAHLALDAPGRDALEGRIAALRAAHPETIIVSFPGDEKQAEGCLAAGRGFFHINAAGGAEPCPFSPYSDTSAAACGLRGALRSPLFARLRSEGIVQRPHTGGCVLFEQEETVKGFL